MKKPIQNQNIFFLECAWIVGIILGMFVKGSRSWTFHLACVTLGLITVACLIQLCTLCGCIRTSIRGKQALFHSPLI